MKKAILALLILVAFGLAMISHLSEPPSSDLGWLVGKKTRRGATWMAAGAAIGCVAGAIGGGILGSMLAPGPGTVLGALTGKDLGIILGGAAGGF